MRKTYADADKAKHKKRKNEKNETANTSNKKKLSGKPAEKNLCRHHGTHPWNECSLNPQSKNYHMNERAREHYHFTNEGRGPPPQW